MSKLIVATLKRCDTSPNGNPYVVGHIVATSFREATWIDRIADWWHRRARRNDRIDLTKIPDTGMNIGVRISDDNYRMLVGGSDRGTSMSSRCANMEFVTDAPKEANISL